MRLVNRIDGGRGRRKPVRVLTTGVLGLGALMIGLVGIGVSTPARAAEPGPADRSQAAQVQAVQNYAQAVAGRDAVGVARNDVVCLIRMMEAGATGEGQFLPESDPVYSWCWDRLAQAHAEVVQSRDLALDELWPGVGKLVNFRDFKRFEIAETRAYQRAPSFFVMPEIGDMSEVPGFTLEALETVPLPHASFQVPGSDRMVAVPTTLVRVRVAYPDPMTAPAANGPGQQDWVVPYKKPVHPVKAVTVKWVVLSGLLQHGFPVDVAVLNIPLMSSMGTPIPFVVDPGGFEQHSTEYWSPKEAQAAVTAGLARVKTLPTRRERISMLNRVLVVNPLHEEGLKAISAELYEGLLDFGARTHRVPVESGPLYQAFNALYWTIQSQTDRMDISLEMEMGGKSEPTPADYLYRLIPAMETLVDLNPGDFETRLKLAMAYQWTNDQIPSIVTPRELLSELSEEQADLRARVLMVLAWSRISKVAWNRHFDDPDIVQGYNDAEAAFQLTSDPLVKFSAAYAKAYSLVFRPKRDNQAMFKLLEEARRWYQQIPGATTQSWVFLLQNDTLKGLVETDPTFQSLMAANS